MTAGSASNKMKKMQVYLDNAATTKIDKSVAKLVEQYSTKDFGNPGSIHSIGQKAKNALETARAAIAKKINAEPSEIIFTSGGTESDSMAIKGIAYASADATGRKGHIITSRFEHLAVLNCCRQLEKEGFKVSYIGVDKDGFVKIEELKRAIRPETILVTIMHANNEIGTIQNITKIGKICAQNKIVFHLDAVQSFAKVSIDVKKSNISLVSLSAHKIHGPRGIGALFVRRGTRLKRLLEGGEQEFGLRPGTENVAGAVGFAEAANLMKQSDIKQMQRLRDHMIKRIAKKIPSCRLNGSQKNRLCNNINISFDFVEGEAVVLHLDKLGISASTGSACTSHKLEPSHVLAAIGVPSHKSHGSIRLSLSKYTTKQEIDYAAGRLKNIIEKLRQMSPITQLKKMHNQLEQEAR
jgi:cysteine desulfurase